MHGSFLIIYYNGLVMGGKIRSLFETHYVHILVLIFIIGIFLRVYRFPDRWGVGSDDMRDVAIAKEAIARREIPLMGSFSSAGPFVFGPIFYWFLMISYLLLGFTLAAPWIIFVLLSIGALLIFTSIGRLIEGKRLALILTFLAAVSPQFVYRSTALSQHAFVYIAMALILLSFIFLWRTGKQRFSFFCGVSLGIAFGMHHQAVNLFIFFPAVFFLPKISFRQKIVGVLLMASGFLIPNVAWFLWDSKQDFANIRNFLDYIFIGQYRLYIPNSWRLFLLDFLPSYWSFVSGGYKIVGLLTMVLVGVYLLYAFIKKILPPVLVVFGFQFFILTLVNRFYHGERSEGYLLYLAPYIILFTGYVIDRLIFHEKKLFLVGLLSLMVILIGSSYRALNYTLNTKKPTGEMEHVTNELITKYPGKKFSVYDYAWRNSDVSYGLSAFLKQKEKTDKTGVPVGINCNGSDCPKNLPTIATLSGLLVVDLSGDTLLNTPNTKWGNVNQEAIYDALIQWQKTSKLTSPFHFRQFLWEKIIFAAGLGFGPR